MLRSFGLAGLRGAIAHALVPPAKQAPSPLTNVFFFFTRSWFWIDPRLQRQANGEYRILQLGEAPQLDG
jgi:hypothetical protein